MHDEMHSESHIIEKLKKKKHRLTAVRRQLVKIFLRYRKHMSPQDVHGLLKKNGLEVNLSTVYREIQFFVDENVIRGVQFADDVQRYELKEEGHHHHLVCTQCDNVEDIYMENDLNSLEKKISRERAFKITHHMLDFYGKCSRCQ